MKLSSQEVTQVAALARLDLSAAEKKQYAGELSRVLDYVAKLEKIDTEGIEPTYQVTGLADVMREDKVKRFKYPAKLVDGAPEQEEGQIKVKGVFN